jgi:flagellar basal body P-ring protein FlgI
MSPTDDQLNGHGLVVGLNGTDDKLNDHIVTCESLVGMPAPASD